MRADADALGATDAGGFAGLAGHRAFVLVVAGDYHLEAARTLVAKLYDALRANLGTCAATGTFGLVNHRETRLRIHLDGVKLARAGAVATSQAAKSARGITAVERRFDLARSIAVVGIDRRAVLARAVALDNRYLGRLYGRCLAQQSRNLGHGLAASHGALRIAKRVHCDQFGGEIATAGTAAATAVCSGKQRLYIVDAGVLLDFEPLSYGKKDCRYQQPYRSKSNNCNKYRIHTVKCYCSIEKTNSFSNLSLKIEKIM